MYVGGRVVCVTEEHDVEYVSVRCGKSGVCDECDVGNDGSMTGVAIARICVCECSV